LSNSTSNLLNDLFIGLLTIASWIIGFWSFLGLAKAIKDIDENRPVQTWKMYLTASAPALVPTFLVVVITSIISFFGTLFFIIPGILFSVWFLFSRYAVVFGDSKIFESLSYSKALTRGRWWSTAWKTALPSIVYVGVLILLLIILVVPFSFFIPSSWGGTAEVAATASPAEVFITVLAKFMGTLVSSVAAPLFVISRVLLYLDLKKNPVSQQSPGTPSTV
jgi:hypothetical protein